MTGPPRIVVFGNSGSGKSTEARRLARRHGCPHMDLDSVAWSPGVEPPARRPLEDSRREIDAFMVKHDGWVIEGCYADLLAMAAPRATELVFLNPGVATCQANARSRPWEPHKYASREAQDANLDMLLDWIEEYERRDDVFSLRAHRRLFDDFRGSKREYESNRRDDGG